MKRNRKKRSIIWTLETAKLDAIVRKSTSIRDILRYLGFESTSGNGSYATLKKRLDVDGIDYSHIPLGLNANKGRKFDGSGKIPIGDILTVKSTYNRGHLKRRLVNEGLLEYKCVECGCDGHWNGKMISLELDHINGIHDDNRLKNLRLLCPNCHAATDTYCGKNINRVKFHCVDCGKSIGRTSKRCNHCNGKFRQMEMPSKELLFKEILELSFVELGKKYNVSDNCIRKWCKGYGLPYRKIDLRKK